MELLPARARQQGLENRHALASTGKSMPCSSPCPNGLLGRSETSIAASTDGQFIVTGWNDAQGFCTPVFGGGCGPGEPNGLSGFGFSSDVRPDIHGWRSFHPSSTISSLAAIHGLELGGFDNATFY